LPPARPPAFCTVAGFYNLPATSIIGHRRPLRRDAEEAALLALVREAKDFLDDRVHPGGYNVGVNVGETAGQTVMHLHVIPRYAGDVEDPRGGVRGVIPERRGY
jgi:DNA-binding transcriptional regulator LsrR (DeoR family)